MLGAARTTGTAVAAALLLAACSPSASGPDPQGSPTAAGESASGTVRKVAPATRLVGRSCDRVTHGFDPRLVVVPGATRGATVVAPPRDADDIPGTPPLTTAGKSMVAWDRAQGIRPGDPRGNVIINAHTWPDGSALGNRLLATLHRGDPVYVRGARARLCYRVTERVEVRAEDGLPRYYDTKGPPRLAILVCSGQRLGPGIWTKRTVWFASLVR
jgi:hypothetical protein